MLVQLEVSFENPTTDDENSLRSVALGHTSDSASVRVFRKANDPQWLIATFTMKTEAQYKAVDRLDRSIRFTLWNREDSIIDVFDRTPPPLFLGATP
jgi:hypothetical protein